MQVNTTEGLAERVDAIEQQLAQLQEHHHALTEGLIQAFSAAGRAAPASLDYRPALRIISGGRS